MNQEQLIGVVLSAGAVLQGAESWNGRLGFMFCLGKVRQIHEAEAVESPRAETEPVVVFLILFCAYSHSLTAL